MHSKRLCIIRMIAQKLQSFHKNHHKQQDANYLQFINLFNSIYIEQGQESFSQETELSTESLGGVSQDESGNEAHSNDVSI